MNETDIFEEYAIAPVNDNADDLQFICALLTDSSNASTLHLKSVPDAEYHRFYNEMKEVLISGEVDDELNYIIRKGIAPIAWLKINGLSEDSLWISMLVVHEKYRRQGVGSFAMNFVEKFARSTGRGNIYIHTTADNTAAIALYKKSGYAVTAENKRQYSDGSNLVEYTLHKEIIID